MPTPNFLRVIDFVLGWEAGRDKKGQLRSDGGLNSHDGSVTKWGIRQASHPKVDVPNLTKEEAEKIYYDQYWMPLLLESRPIDEAAALFDTAVNCGVNKAKQFKDKAEEYKVKDLAKTVIQLREAFYFNLESMDRKKYGKFMKGWMARTNDLKKFIDILRQPT